MEAEKATSEFYMSLADQFENDEELRKMLLYIASM